VNYGENIGIIGAVRGEWLRLSTALTALKPHGVRKVVQLGKLGLGENEFLWDKVPAQLRRSLESLNLKLLFLDGAHDPVRVRLRQSEPERWYWRREEPRSLTSHLAYLPRGFRDQLSPSVRLAVFGGGDTDEPDVRIEEDDLEALGPDYATVLLTHLPPSTMRTVEAISASAALVDDAMRAVRPSLMFASADTLTVRTLAHRSARGPFVTRVVLLPSVTTEGLAGAVLNTRTFEVRLIDIDGHTVDFEPEVTDLATQSSGRWVLHTETSQHVVDLDHRTWERIPGPDAPHIATPNTGILRTFDDLAVGKTGYLTLVADDPLIEYRWARTSLIEQISRTETRRSS